MNISTLHFAKYVCICTHCTTALYPTLLFGSRASHNTLEFSCFSFCQCQPAWFGLVYMEHDDDTNNFTNTEDGQVRGDGDDDDNTPMLFLYYPRELTYFTYVSFWNTSFFINLSSYTCMHAFYLDVM